MASSLETNKILAAILTAGIFASGAGVVSRIIYHPTVPEEPSYFIEVAAEADQGGGDEGAGEEVSVAALLASADLAGGEKGAKKCVSCHSFDEGGANKIGPNLYGIVGRDIASVAGYAYSDALIGVDGDWNYEALDAFLEKPKDFAPGTKMAYAGMKSAEDRADLIIYLRSLAADPIPLPEADEAATDTAQEADGGQNESQEDVAAEEEPTADEAETVAAAAVEQGENLAEAADDAAEEVAQAASDVVESTEETATAAAEAVSDAASEAAETAADVVADAGETAKDIAEATASEASEAASTVTEAAENAADSVSETAGATVAAVAAAASDAADAAGSTVDAAAGGLVAMIADGDVAKGEKVSKKCKACHVFDEGGKNKLGPALWGIVGRDIASHDGFNYSGALSELEGDWTYDKLDQFLAAPKKYVPGSKMVFAGLKKEEDRANLLAYLRTLDAEPAPLN